MITRFCENVTLFFGSRFNLNLSTPIRECFQVCRTLPQPHLAAGRETPVAEGGCFSADPAGTAKRCPDTNLLDSLPTLFFAPILNAVRPPVEIQSEKRGFDSFTLSKSMV